MKLKCLRAFAALGTLTGLSLFLGACQSIQLNHEVLPEKSDFFQIVENPRAETLEKLPPYDRAGVAIGEQGIARLVFHPPAQTPYQVLYIRWIAGKKQWLHSPNPFPRWPLPSKEALASSRRKSPYHAPLEVFLPGTGQSVWVAHDFVCHSKAEGHESTRRRFLRACESVAEIYLRKPDFLEPPQSVVNLGGMDYVFPEMLPHTRKKSDADQTQTLILHGRLYQRGETELHPSGAFSRFEIKPWKLDFLKFISENALLPETHWGQTRLDLETQTNEQLIEWKIEEMTPWLRLAEARAIRSAAIQIEKALLKLDLRSNQLKDAVDLDAQQLSNHAPEKAREVAQIIDQRKTILMAILGTFKQAMKSKGDTQ